MTKESKTNKFQLPPKTHRLVYCAVFGSLFHRVGVALRNDLAPGCFLFVFSMNPQVFFVCVFTESTGVFLFVLTECTRWSVGGNRFL